MVVMGAREKVVEVGLRRVEDEARRAEGSVADEFSEGCLVLAGFISVSVCELLELFALAAAAAVAERWRAERVVLVD